MRSQFTHKLIVVVDGQKLSHALIHLFEYENVFCMRRGIENDRWVLRTVRHGLSLFRGEFDHGTTSRMIFPTSSHPAKSSRRRLARACRRTLAGTRRGSSRPCEA